MNSLHFLFPNVTGMAPSPHMIPTIVRRQILRSEAASQLFGFSLIWLLIADMTDNIGFGKEKRREGNLEILAGRDTFR